MTNPRTVTVILIVVTALAVLSVWWLALGGQPAWSIAINGAIWTVSVLTWRRWLRRVRSPEFQARERDLTAAIARAGKGNCIMCRQPLPPKRWPLADPPPFHNLDRNPECLKSLGYWDE